MLSLRASLLFLFASALVLGQSGPVRTPDLGGLTEAERQSIEAACAGAKYVRGPAAYNQCLQEQLATLGIDPHQTPPRPRNLPAPRVSQTPQPPPMRVRATTIDKPTFSWPPWSKETAGVMLKQAMVRSLAPADVFKASAPSVYAVLASPSLQRFISGRDVSQGSAVAVSGKHLLTNCHLLEGSGYIAIIQGEHVEQAKLISSSPSTDHCVIRVSSIELKAVNGIRSFSDLSVGERVYSIGTPAGLEQTLGEGLISGLRENDGVRLIQTSAPISPGSSGGGLFDAAGNLIGITTFMLRGSQALNFAIAASEFYR